ncbi:MAG: hypothetical protein H6Q61_144 [Firmicutes bacterium]|nr:hypothetical protein [Bacillota bacterium]
MKKHYYKFLSALFVVAMLTMSASASASTCPTVTAASQKSFDCTALLNQIFSVQTGSNCEIKLPWLVSKDCNTAKLPSAVKSVVKAATTDSTSVKAPCTKNTVVKATTADNTSVKAATANNTVVKTATTDSTSAKAPCTGNATTKAPCTGNTCNVTSCTGNSCAKNTCTGNNCSDTSCTGNSCDKTPAVTSPVKETPVVTTPVKETPVVTTPVKETPVVTTPVKETPVAETPSGISAYEMEVINLVNEIRTSNGLNALKANAQLSEIARTKSQDMLDKGYFAHQSPTYGSPFDMLRQFGVTYRTAGENIAYGYATPAAVVEGWMNSQGHRENILKSTYTEIGVGYVQNGNYWTQLFTG